MKYEYAEAVADAINAFAEEDTDFLEEAAAGQHSLGDDESGLPFENGFDMAMAYGREAALAKYGGQLPTIYAADHSACHTRFFFFGSSEEDVLEKIAASKAEYDARPYPT